SMSQLYSVVEGFSFLNVVSVWAACGVGSMLAFFIARFPERLAQRIAGSMQHMPNPLAGN
ncbi:MAG: hypothetical protein AAF725_13640, partial [Acidobacteriota bacterium]